MTRFYFPNIVVGTDSQNPSRTVDPDQLELMFVDDGSMDYLLDKVDVFGTFAQFGQTAKRTTASDAMIARMIPMLAERGIKFATSYAGLLGYGGTPNFLTGINTPTEHGTLTAANDLAPTGIYSVLESLGCTVDWNIMDSPLDRVTLNGSNKARHTAHHGFGVTASNNNIVYTASAAGSAGNSRTVAHIQSGNNTPLSVSASTTVVLSDSFTRVTVDGWGSPDTGAAYVLTGTAANFDTDGSVGTIAIGSAGTLRRASNALTGSTANQRARIIFSLGAVPTGNQATVSLCLRQADTSNYYEMRVTCKTNGALQAGIFKCVAGTTTNLDSTGEIFGLTLTAGRQFYAQATAIGTALALTIWQVGTTKPANANITYIDSSITAAGGVSILCGTGTAETGLPLVITLDEFAVYDTDGDGNAVTVHLHTDSGGTADSTAADVIAAVNADFDASGLVIASNSVGSSGVGVAAVFAATNLGGGDDGVNLSNTDTATALVAYIATVHAARPNMMFGFTIDIRHPYDGVMGYSAQSFPTNQMPDFKDFWSAFWPKAVAAGIKDVVGLVMFDSTPELNSALIDPGPTVAAIDWRARILAAQRQIEADGVPFIVNVGMSSNAFPSLDLLAGNGLPHNSVGPASEQSYQDHIIQGYHDDSVYRRRNAPDLAKPKHLIFGPFGYYPRVQLPVTNPLSQARSYLLVGAAYDRDDFAYLGEGPQIRLWNPTPRVSIAA